MFHFPRAVGGTLEVSGAGVASQREPKTYLGLERMLLKWLSLMGFVVMTSISLIYIPGIARLVLQWMWVPFAVVGLAYSIWKYYWRLNRLRTLVVRSDTAHLDRAGNDPWAYAGLVGLLMAVMTTAFVLTFIQNRQI